MKVALVSEWLDAWRGGAETSALQFLHHLVDAGADVHVFTRSRPASAPGLTVHTVSGASLSRTRRSVTFAHRVERLLRGESFDIVHGITACRGLDLYEPRGGTVAETIERNLALRSSPTARSLKRYANRFNLKQRYTLRLERALLRDPSGPTVVALSDYVVEQLRRHYALPDGRIRKVFNGVDPDPTTPAERARHREEIRLEYNVPADATLVLCVAHNFRLKGVACWMEALAALRDRGVDDVRSLVLGRDDSVRWRRLADRLSLNSRLTFVGPTDRVGEFYHAADVLVHPTYYDPCSRVVLEAMSSGLACITTRWDGAAELVSDGCSGFVLVEPTDVGRLADCVQKLRDPAVRKAMGDAARVSAQRASMAQHAQELLGVYEDVVHRGRLATDGRSRLMKSV